MSEEPRGPGLADGQPLMDELLRAGIPEIKLALGEIIDRENSRPLPARYARLLPETLLLVNLRADAAAALAPITGDLERELTDSCNRHGSLYDRTYRVRLQRSEDPDAPLYAVSAHSGRDLIARPAEQDAGSGEATAVQSIPAADPERDRKAHPAPAGWEPGRWLLVVEGAGGEEREAFRLTESTTTVGRRTEDPELRATVAISEAPHVSRRQLALVWEERDGAPGFKVYNLGLNEVHLPGLDIPGARAGKQAIDLRSVAETHVGWLPPGVPLRIGEHGPTLRVEEVPSVAEEPWTDPDATVFE